MKRAIVFVVFIALAACATPQTTLNNDVLSGCIESRAVYNGHRLSCKVTKCSAAILFQMEAVQNEAKAFCAKNPPSTPANISTIQSLVAKQRAVGRP